MVLQKPRVARILLSLKSLALVLYFTKKAYFCVIDYDIFDHHEYWLCESRFYCNTGEGVETFPNSHSLSWADESDSIAVRASRSARFEHHRP